MTLSQSHKHLCRHLNYYVANIFLIKRSPASTNHAELLYKMKRSLLTVFSLNSKFEWHNTSKLHVWFTYQPTHPPTTRCQPLKATILIHFNKKQIALRCLHCKTRKLFFHALNSTRQLHSTSHCFALFFL